MTHLHALTDWLRDSPHEFICYAKRRKEWKSWTVAQFVDQIEKLAQNLGQSTDLGVRRVGVIAGNNCPEWLITEYALQLSGALSAGIFPGAMVHHWVEVIRITQPKWIFVGSEAERKKANLALAELASKGEAIGTIQVLDLYQPRFESEPKSEPGMAPGILPAEKWVNRVAKISPQKGAFLVFTLSSEGQDLAAELSFQNLWFAANTLAQGWDVPGGQGERIFSFLPLCHVAERLQTVGVSLARRIPVWFASRPELFAREIKEVRPTLLLAVPRVWDKVGQGILEALNQVPSLLRGIIQNSQKRLETGSGFQVDRWLALYLRRAAGLGEVKRCASGAARLSPETVALFRGLGIDLLNAFGQTESCGLLTFTQLDGAGKLRQAGTIGKMAPGIEFKVEKNGDMLTRGPHVFLGYYRNELETRRALPGGGWLRTGDQLSCDAHSGLWSIQGRSRLILKSSLGKMVAPVRLEKMAESIPGVERAFMTGEGEKTLGLILLVSATLSGKSPSEKEILRLLQENQSHLATYERAAWVSFVPLSEIQIAQLSKDAQPIRWAPESYFPNFKQKIHWLTKSGV